MSKRLAKKNAYTPTEHEEQSAFFDWVRIKRNSDRRFKCIFANANAGKRSIRAGQYMKDEGLEPGVPDITVAIPTNGWPGLFIELKRTPNKLTPEQDRMLTELSENGYKTAVCWCADEAMDTVLDYLGADIREKRTSILPIDEKHDQGT